ncbi:MAG: aminotransferase [Anaeromyxobacteraceae bacterium]
MRPPPRGWPRMSVAVHYEDPRAAIAWLQKAFGFEAELVVPGQNGRIEHSQLVLDGALVMVNSLGGRGRPGEDLKVSPKALGGKVTSSLMLYVDDADAHCARARAAGATISVEPTTSDYGAEFWADRSYEAVDPEGHRWWFVQRVRG